MPPRRDAPQAAAGPFGFCATSSDAYDNHCTGDGSHVVIAVEVFGPTYEWCVGPGAPWRGAAGRIGGAAYAGHTC